MQDFRICILVFLYGNVLKPSNVFCLLILLLVLHSPTSCKADNLVLHSPSYCTANNILYSDETLYSVPHEQYLEYESYRLVMRNNCDLVLFDKETVVWSSKSEVDIDCYCTLHTNGSLIIHRPYGEGIWHTNTAGVESHYVLILQKDRNVVIYGPAIWATGTNETPEMAIVNNIGGAPELESAVGAAVLHSPTSCKADNILYSGETLNSEDSLQYGENYRLVMQSDCNLVLYDNNDPKWASNTGGLGRNCNCTLRNDGDLVILNQDGSIIWRSNTTGRAAHCILILQKDLNVVIYGPNIWATNTTDENVSHAPAVAVVNNIGGRNAKFCAPKLASVVGAVVY